MHPTWQALLRDTQPDTASGGAAAVDDEVFGALPSLGALRAEGADALPFLQGQLTCDVAEVGASASRLGAWCNPKGRIAVLFRLVGRDDGFDLVLPAEQVDETCRRLGMYVLRARVTLSPAPDRLCLWGRGEAVERVLRGRVGELPSVAGGVITGGGAISVVRLPGGEASYLVLAPAAAIPGIWAALDAAATRVDETAFELDRVRAAEPAVVAATAGAFVPQMVNLELLDGVSFTKGCYIGQEVVARTQHLGKLKRRMFRARVGAGVASPAPGDPIYDAAGGGGQSVGAVVRAAPVADGAREILTVLRLDAVERGNLHLQQILGPSLELLELPYDLEQSGPG